MSRNRTPSAAGLSFVVQRQWSRLRMSPLYRNQADLNMPQWSRLGMSRNSGSSAPSAVRGSWWPQWSRLGMSRNSGDDVEHLARVLLASMEPARDEPEQVMRAAYESGMSMPQWSRLGMSRNRPRRCPRTCTAAKRLNGAGSG